MNTGAVMLDRNRLGEIDLDEMDKFFDFSNKALLRIAPTNDAFDYNDRTQLHDADDDVFLTEAEEKVLFPTRYGIDPELQEEEREILRT